MREDVKTRLAGAGGALVTAIAAGALQSGKLGTSVLALQGTATVAVLSWLPYLARTGMHKRIPKFVSWPAAIAWAVTCCGPALCALIIELFTGHRRPDSRWYDAVWRIYAIMALWIVFALANERYIRPWWRENSERFLGGVRQNSISGRVHKMAVDERTAKLEAIKARVIVQLKKRKLTERTMANKKAEIEKAEGSIKKAEGMWEKAKQNAEKCGESEKADAKDVVDTMMDMVENARSHEKGLHEDVDRMDLELAEVQVELDKLQGEWTEALHIQNYTGFYR